MSEHSRADFEERIIQLASQNPEFREQFLRDPKGALSKVLGAKLPEEFNIVVHEEDANTLHFVLPASGDELSRSELAMASGGVCWSDCVYVVY